MIRLLLAFAFSLTALSAKAEIDIQEITSPGGIEAWLGWKSGSADPQRRSGQ